MSPLNVLPSGPPEKLYLELPRDNFRLSRIGNIEKQISEEIENYRKVNKKYIKAQTAMHFTAIGLSSLLAALTTTGVALTLTGPGIIISAPLGAVAAFCGAGSAVLTNLSKKLNLKVTKHEKNLLTAHCQTQLH